MYQLGDRRAGCSFRFAVIERYGVRLVERLDVEVSELRWYYRRGGPQWLSRTRAGYSLVSTKAYQAAASSKFLCSGIFVYRMHAGVEGVVYRQAKAAN